MLATSKHVFKIKTCRNLFKNYNVLSINFSLNSFRLPMLKSPDCTDFFVINFYFKLWISSICYTHFSSPGFVHFVLCLHHRDHWKWRWYQRICKSKDWESCGQCRGRSRCGCWNRNKPIQVSNNKISQNI